MQILYLCAYYEPEIAASSYIFDNIRHAYIDAGYDIILFTPMPTRGISKEIRIRYKNIKYEEKFNGKLKINRFSMFREGKNPIGRALRYFCCNVVHLWKGILAKEIDIIISGSTPPTQGMVASTLKKIKKVPFIYYLQDIFPDSLVNAGLTHENSFLWKIGRIIENYTYRNADKIIVISEDFKKNIVAKGVPEDKIEVIYNWVDENAVVPVDRDDNILFDRYSLDKEKFYITYCGNIGFTQNMDMLIGVAKALEYNRDIQFVIIGDGAYKPVLERLILDKEIRNVKLLPFQPYDDISHVFSLGDVGLIISKANVSQNSVPSKTWSIMAAARPVLASFDLKSELHSIIKEADCGICVAADDKELLRATILDMYNDRFELDKKGKNGRLYILRNLTKTKGTEKYVNALKNILN